MGFILKEGDIISITIILYIIAARYIFGSNNISGIVSQLSTKTKGLASGLLSDPHRMESIIGLVRTAAPLTSDKTVVKINTYLPPIEKLSTLLGMYTFLNRAQNYAPIQSLSAKSPMEKVSALISNGNIPIAKILAQPLIANNMDKIMSSVAKGVINNGNINDMLSSISKNFSNNQQADNSTANDSNDIDFSSLMESFMPIINNIMSDNTSSTSSYETQDDKNRTNEEFKQPTVISNEHKYQEEHDTQNKSVEYDETPKKNIKKNTPIHIRQRRKKNT